MVKIKITATLLFAALSANVPALLSAQDYDDIYYNPKTAKDKRKTAVKQDPVVNNSVATADYRPADSYIPSATDGLDVSVDEYNRRGMFADGGADSARVEGSATDFECTKQIRKYYNPSLASDDDTVVSYLAAEPSVVNIYVTNPYPDYYSYYNPWGWGFYNPYYTPYYPSWRWGYYSSPWSWGYGWYGDPYWGYAPGWGYGPSWGWSWAPGYHRHSHRPLSNFRRNPSVRPDNGSRPGSIRGGYSSNYRGGSHSITTAGRDYRRPSADGYVTGSGKYPGNSTVSGTRPGSTSTKGSYSRGGRSYSSDRSSSSGTRTDRSSYSRDRSSSSSSYSSSSYRGGSGSYNRGNSGGSGHRSSSGRSGGGRGRL